MIPRIIHYCWFGEKPLSELAQKCIESWKIYCPEYQIIRWDETNFNIDYCAYTKEAFDNKKWAFITDVVRLYVLYMYGGIYMDTDVEVIKSIDSILGYQCVSGFESETAVPTGLIASEKANPFIKKLLDEYDEIHFIRDDGSLDMTTNVKRITKACVSAGLVLNNTMQTVNGFTILPKDYLCPKNCVTKELQITDNTMTIHHFDGSWHTDEEKFIFETYGKLKQKYTNNVAHKIAIFKGYMKFRGILGTIKGLFDLKVK